MRVMYGTVYIKRSKIQSPQGVWAKQLQQPGYLCILSARSYYKEEDIGLVTAET